MTPGNEWDMEVKCLPILQGAQGVSNQRNNWRSLMVVYPEAEVKLKHNDIEVTLPSLQEDVEIAAFGRPGKDDKKRMQMAIFAKQPKQGRDWKIWVYLVDDTSPACEVYCAIMFIYLFVCLKCYRISLLYDHDFIASASQPAIDHSLPLRSRHYPLPKTAKALESFITANQCNAKR